MIQPLLGFDANGNLKLYSNPYGELNEITADSIRFQRGVALPEIDLSNQNALECLRAFALYFKESENGTLRKRSAIASKPSARKKPAIRSVRGTTFGSV